MISERTKAGPARSKNKFGLRHPMKRSKVIRRRLQILAVAAVRKAALERAEGVSRRRWRDGHSNTYAQTSGGYRRDDRRDDRLGSRAQKQACKAGDEKSRPECRGEAPDQARRQPASK
jgi:hypothetical protein